MAWFLASHARNFAGVRKLVRVDKGSGLIGAPSVFGLQQCQHATRFPEL
jgi:hypothetical protein